MSIIRKLQVENPEVYVNYKELAGRKESAKLEVRNLRKFFYLIYIA